MVGRDIMSRPTAVLDYNDPVSYTQQRAHETG